MAYLADYSPGWQYMYRQELPGQSSGQLDASNDSVPAHRSDVHGHAMMLNKLCRFSPRP